MDMFNNMGEKIKELIYSNKVGKESGEPTSSKEAKIKELEMKKQAEIKRMIEADLDFKKIEELKNKLVILINELPEYQQNMKSEDSKKAVDAMAEVFEIPPPLDDNYYKWMKEEANEFYQKMQGWANLNVPQKTIGLLIDALEAGRGISHEFNTRKRNIIERVKDDYNLKIAKVKYPEWQDKIEELKILINRQNELKEKLNNGEYGVPNTSEGVYFIILDQHGEFKEHGMRLFNKIWPNKHNPDGVDLKKVKEAFQKNKKDLQVLESPLVDKILILANKLGDFKKIYERFKEIQEQEVSVSKSPSSSQDAFEKFGPLSSLENGNIPGWLLWEEADENRLTELEKMVDEELKK